MSTASPSGSYDKLITQLLSGDKAALLELYNQNWGMISSHIYKNNGSEDDAKDILHDALIVLWNNLRKKDFELTCKPSTYTMSVASNLWLKKLEKAKRESSVDITTLEVSEAPFTTHQLDVKKAMLALDEIGDTCKTILSKFYFDGFSMAEIAEQMHYANADTAKAKKHQCFKRLAEIIKSRYTIADLLG